MQGLSSKDGRQFRIDNIQTISNNVLRMTKAGYWQALKSEVDGGISLRLPVINRRRLPTCGRRYSARHIPERV